MRYWKRLLAAGAIVAGGGVAAGQTASAGDSGIINTVEVSVHINGTEAPNIAAWTPELYIGDSLIAISNCDAPITNINGPFSASLTMTCPVIAPGVNSVDVTMGYRTAPEAYTVDASCTPGAEGPQERLENTTAAITVSGGQFPASCTLNMVASVLVIDKAFQPHTFNEPLTSAVPPTDPLGGAAPGDFTFEIFDGEGAAYGGTLTDVDADYCTSLDLFSGDPATPCAAMDIAAGTYSLGEVSTPGYQPESVECAAAFVLNEDLGPDFEGANFTVNEEFTIYHCQVENQYVESPVTVSVDVINDDGGTATPSDFTMELYSAADLGSPVATGVCDDTTNVCIDGDFPIGDYVVGQTGPDGYTVSVNQTVTPVEEAEALADANAAFTLEANSSVAVEVVNDDVAPEVTTTTAAPTTTVAPTTTAAAITTTTAFDASGVTLPQTGNGQQSTLALAALFMLLLGGGAIALARRQH